MKTDMFIRDIDDNFPEEEGYIIQLLTDSQDIEDINKEYNQKYGLYFIVWNKHGEVIAVYGNENNIPYNHQKVYFIGNDITGGIIQNEAREYINRLAEEENSGYIRRDF